MEKKIDIHHAFWYFIIFSVVGLMIETFFCYATTGVIESRKGLLWGPFCPIYGVGAVVLICLLQKYKDKDWKVFIYGGVLGSVVEYILSFALEAIYSSRFWDYSYLSLNLNGRICMTYAIYWSILSIVLIKYITPWIDKHIDKISSRKKAIVEKILLVFLVVDAIATVWAITAYKNRVLAIYYQRTNLPEEEGIFKQIEENYFTNERMMKTFPNLRVQLEDGTEKMIKEILN